MKILNRGVSEDYLRKYNPKGVLDLIGKDYINVDKDWYIFFDEIMYEYVSNRERLMKTDFLDWIDLVDFLVRDEIKVIKYKLLFASIFGTMDEIEEIFLFDDKKVSEEQLEILPYLEKSSDKIRQYYGDNVRRFLRNYKITFR